jgi:hypothetical protein
MDELRAAGGFGDLPLTVVTADPERLIDEVGNEDIVDLLGQRLQDLARSSTSGELTVALGSGHAIAREQPDVVIDAVRRVLARIAAG